MESDQPTAGAPAPTTPGRPSTMKTAAAAIGLVALIAGAIWVLGMQASATPSTPGAPASMPTSAPASVAGDVTSAAPACCANPGPANMGRMEDVGPESAPVDVLGCQGTCEEHKIAGDMLVALAAEDRGLLRVRLWPVGTRSGPIPDTECASYMLRAKDYTVPEAIGSWEGYDVLCEKSPGRGGWEIAEREEAVRDALVACGGKPTDKRIAPALLAKPPTLGGGSSS